MTKFDQIWPNLTKSSILVKFGQICIFVFFFLKMKALLITFCQGWEPSSPDSLGLNNCFFIPKKQHWTHDDFLNSVHFSWIANMNFRFHEIEILEKCCVQNLLQTWFNKCFQAFIWWAKSFTWPYCTYIFLFVLEFICMKYFPLLFQPVNIPKKVHKQKRNNIHNFFNNIKNSLI